MGSAWVVKPEFPVPGLAGGWACGDEGELVGSESVIAPIVAEVPQAGRLHHLIVKGSSQGFCESRAFKSPGLDTPQPETHPTVCHTQLLNLNVLSSLLFPSVKLIPEQVTSLFEIC